MGRNWKILRSAVEQEILFPSKEAYESYLNKLETDKIIYEIVNERKDKSGLYVVTMRKPYNNTKFLQRDLNFKDNELKTMIGQAIEYEAAIIEKRVKNNPSLNNLEMPEGSYEQLMEMVYSKK